VIKNHNTDVQYTYNDYHILQNDNVQEQKSTVVTTPHVLIPIPEPVVPLGIHRENKNGRQRFRWNLIFNLLVWIILSITDLASICF
jgi:hypothetical protein